MRDWRNKIFLSGNKSRSETFIGPAQSQMETLKREMSMRGLTQGVRRVWLHEDVYVECAVCFNHMVCRIWTPPVQDVTPEEIEMEARYLLVVTGNETRKINVSGVNGVFGIEEVTCGDDGYGTIEFATEVYSEPVQTLYGSFVHCFDGTLLGVSSLSTGTIDACYRRHFADWYEHRELDQATMADPDDYLSIFSALDNPPVSDLACSNLIISIRREWTKVYDDFSLGAFSFVELGGSSVEQWGAVASFQGQAVTWSGGTWYGPFTREVRRNTHEIITGNGIDTHIGWDIWKDGDDYYCGLIGDMEETLHVFRLNQVSLEMDPVGTHTSTVKHDQFFNESNPDWHEKYTRLLGYGFTDGVHNLYWGQPGRDNPVYYKETVSTGLIQIGVEEFAVEDTQSTYPGDLTEALWNPIKRELYAAFESDLGPGNIGVPEVELETRSALYYVAHPSAGLFCPVYFAGDERIDGDGSWHCSGEVATNGAVSCPLWVDYNGETYEFPGTCYIRADATHYPLTYYFGTRYYLTRVTVDEKEYRGRVLIDSDYYGKGHHVLYDRVYMFARRSSTDPNASCCGGGGMWADVQPGGNTSECRPYSVKRYDFRKWTWVNDTKGHAYETLVDTQGQSEPDEDGNISCVWNDNWESITKGNTAFLKAASGWPYDYGWTSILLSGEDRSGNNWGGSVIYKDLVDGGFFMVDHNGTHHAIGEFDRAFFTVHTEDEVING